MSKCENTKVFSGWLQCDCRPFKQALLSTIKRWSFMFKRHLSTHVISRWTPAWGPAWCWPGTSPRAGVGAKGRLGGLVAPAGGGAWHEGAYQELMVSGCRTPRKP